MMQKKMTHILQKVWQIGGKTGSAEQGIEMEVLEFFFFLLEMHCLIWAPAHCEIQHPDSNNFFL